MWVAFIIGLVLGGFITVKLWRLFQSIITRLYDDFVSGEHRTRHDASAVSRRKGGN